MLEEEINLKDEILLESENSEVSQKEENNNSEVNNNLEDNNKNYETDIKKLAQKLADKMVARKLKGMPSKEEIQEFKTWKSTQDEETAKTQELYKENQALKLGVDVEDLDYVLYKINKIDGVFEENLKTFLKNNPKYIKKEYKTNFSSQNNFSVNKKNNVEDILKTRHPDIFK